MNSGGGSEQNVYGGSVVDGQRSGSRGLCGTRTGPNISGL